MGWFPKLDLDDEGCAPESGAATKAVWKGMAIQSKSGFFGGGKEIVLTTIATIYHKKMLLYYPL